MYATIDQFAIDKAVNTIVEEGIAPLYIREYYRLQGRKVWKVEKNMADLQGSRAYDLVDGRVSSGKSSTTVSGTSPGTST